MKNNKYTWILWLILAVVFAYNIVTAESVSDKVIQGILVIILLCTACYEVYQSLKDKK